MTTRKFVHVLNVVVAYIGMEIVFGNARIVIIQKKTKRIRYAIDIVIFHEEVKGMKRDELKSQIDDLMNQYANEEIDGATYSQKMMKLTTSAQNDDEDDE